MSSLQRCIEGIRSSQCSVKKASAVVLIQHAFENCRKFFRDSPKAKAINDEIMEFMALDDQPFSVVKDQGFDLEPRYTLPSRYFADVSLPALYDMVATHIHSLIDTNVSVTSFTMDIRTSDVSPVRMLSSTS